MIVERGSRLRKQHEQLEVLHACLLLLAFAFATSAAGQTSAPTRVSTQSKNVQFAEARAGTGQYRYTNRRIHSKSPYPLLHAHNPVDWTAWGNVTFDTPRKATNPIFLSFSYS